MRVIGGAARGRLLRAPRDPGVRPTSDRVREAIFDILGHLGAVEDARVADLFAGSGALGIEALSRGAASVVFVESRRAVASTITANLAAAGLGGSSEVVVADALAWCRRAPAGIDLCLCDPPYAYGDWPTLLERLPGRLVVCESDRELNLPARFAVHRVYRYGTTLVTVAHRSGGGDDGVRA